MLGALLLGSIAIGCSPSEKLVAVTVDAPSPQIRAQLPQALVFLDVLVQNSGTSDRSYRFAAAGDPASRKFNFPLIFGITIEQPLTGFLRVSVVAKTANPSDKTASGMASIDLATVLPDQPKDLFVPLVPSP